MRDWRIYLVLFAVSLMQSLFTPVMAQDNAAPIVEVELSDTEVIPGQPTVLRVTVLVPTWLPKPVTFPTFEVPDLMVKLPERATSPVSRTIDGETWSGVSRGYRISPMIPGQIFIPAQELTIFWAEPGKTDPLVTKVAIDPLSLTGIVPDGAEALDPFIAASGIKLTEEVSTDARELKPGDSLTRTVVLEIDGTSPLFVPKLLPPHEVQGVASYPAEPYVRETTDRNWVSGRRAESTTLVAESGGTGAVPAIGVSWFNLETLSIETARIEGFDLTVDGPKARNWPEVDLRLLGLMALFGVALAFGLFHAVRWMLPRFRIWLQARREVRRSTERWAYKQVQNAVRERDYGAVLAQIAVWEMRLPAQNQSGRASLQTALSETGQTMFGKDQADYSAAWIRLAAALKAYRMSSLAIEKQRQGRSDLSPINPSV
ncbi:MAG: hypothetical protein AB3N11_12930 [Arenibacterium sp.]